MSRTVLALFAAFTLISEAFAQPIDNPSHRPGDETRSRFDFVETDTFTVYGPRKFERAGGSSTTSTDVLNLPQGASPPFTIYITNGESNGNRRVSGAQIKLNGTIIVQSSESGSSVPSLARSVSLIARNTLEIRLTGSSHSFVSIRITGIDRTPPQLVVARPANNLITSQSKVTVSGNASDATAVRVTVNGTNIPVGHHGEFSTHVTLAQGSNTITIIAKDASNNPTTLTRTVYRDNVRPTLTITEPANGFVTASSTVTVRGIAIDPSNGSGSSVVSVKVNGVSATVDGSGNFSQSVSLREGKNKISVVATDAAKNSVRIERKITRDTNPPKLYVCTPANNTTTGDSSVTVSGKVTDKTVVTLTLSLNGGAAVSIPLRCMGLFKQKVLLAQGTNTLKLTATDAAGNRTSVTRTVTRRITSLRLIVSSPTDASLTTASSVQVQGTVGGVSPVTVRVNGTTVSIATDGSFSMTVLLVEGFNVVTVTARDGANNTYTIQRLVIRDTTSPVITITDPDEGFVTKEAMVVVGGTVEDSTSVTVTVNGAPAIVAGNGEFTSTVSFPGEVDTTITVTVVATDTLGHTSTATRKVRRDTTRPTLTITSPDDGVTTAESTITLQGTVSDASAVTVTVNGDTVTVGENGSFSRAIALDPETNTIVVTASDAVGNVATVTRSVTRETGAVLPPDPSTVAPPLDRTVPTTMAASTEFLYTGANPIQSGVAPGTIEPVRAAVIRGKVLDRNNQPLSGVQINILNHAEFGSTLSRADGMFDMAVNGGGVLTVSYSKQGFLPAQRQADAPWQDFIVVPDAVLVQLDPKVTVVSFSAPIEVARGSVVTDDAGTREATLLFSQGTTATMVLPDNTTQTLASLSVRATEYSVGPNGPNMMPALLPPTSSYTYCVELSADEAIAAGAKEVRLSQPAVFYVENFRGIDVGTNVPSAHYDRSAGVWVPIPDGRIIKILSTDGGIATIDADGDGLPDAPDSLAVLGFTDAERTQLAALYNPGHILWRVQVTHFSIYDGNYGVIVVIGARRPTVKPPGEQTVDDGCITTGGSIIDIQNQTLGESIPITGTPITLNYTSSRVPGLKDPYSLKIPLSNSEIPSVAREIVLGISVAGRSFQYRFPPDTNLSYVFNWDGKDAYGRTVQGRQPVNVSVGYKYDAYYTRPPAGTGSSFALASGIPGPWPAPPVILGINWEGTIGTWKTPLKEIGGFSLNAHRVYDPGSRVVQFGDGTKRSANSLGNVINTVAGSQELQYPTGVAIGPDGSVFVADGSYVKRIRPDGQVEVVAGTGVRGYSGDGGPATKAALNGPEGIAVAPDGTIYIADVNNFCIRKVDLNGIITTVAGNGQYGFTDDGGPAVLAKMGYLPAVAAGADGSIYFTDESNGRIRRVGTDGIISTIAGPNLWEAMGLAVGKDGSVYFAEANRDQVCRVTPDGIIQTVAGGGWDFESDGGPATLAALYYPVGVAVDPNGILYIAETGNGVVRRVTPDGIITTFAGNREWGTGSDGDGGPAVNAILSNPTSLAAGPDGSVYFLDYDRLRKVSPTMPGFTAQENVVASEDASEMYVFDQFGKHLRTLDAMTGTRRFEFTYNGSGLLAGVRDVDSLFTTIERDANGNPVAIVSPFGQRTALTLNGNGYLASITNPANETLQFGYTADGLMTSRRDAKGGEYRYTYNSSGALVRYVDPTGGYKTFLRRDFRNGYEVMVRTAEGRKTTYEVRTLATGGMRMTNTDEAGLSTVTIDNRNGKTTTTSPDGTVTTVVSSPDPRFGMQSPLSTVTVRTPAGLTSTVSQSRLISQMSGVQVTGVTDKTVVNRRTYTSIYKALQGTEREIKLGGPLTDFGFAATAGSFNSIVGQPGTTVAGNGDDETFSSLPIGFDFPFGGQSNSRIAVCTNGWLSFNDATTDVNHGHSDPNDLVAASNIYPLIAPLYDDLVVNGNIYYTTTGTARNRIFTVEWDNVGWNHWNGGNSISFQVILHEETGNIQFVYSPGPDGITYGGAVIGMANADGIVSVSDLATSATLSRGSENDYIAVEPPDGLTFTFTPPQAFIVSVPAGAKGFFQSVTPEGRKSFTFIDSRGRVIQESVPGVAPVGYTYDSQGRLVQAQQGGRISTFTYDSRSRLATSTDPLDRTTSFVYDSVGRITKQTLPDGKEIAYSYDSNSNLTSLTPPGRPAHLFDYTSVDLTKRYLPPLLNGDTTATSYFYNLDRQITKTLRPDSINVAVEYDTVGCGTCGPTARPKTITFDRGQLNFFYHPTSGLLSALTAPGGNTLSYTYDGSMPTSVQWSGEVAGTVGVAYDNNFRVTQQTVNGGNEVSFQYDQDGLLRQAGDMMITRDPANGRISATQLGNVTTGQTYSSAGELESYQAKFGSNVLFETRYVRDSLGRISELSETVQGNTKVMRYGYDVGGRLEKVWRNDTLISTYTYDDNGNRLSHTSLTGTMTGTYDAQDRLLTYGAASYLYTPNGELQAKVEGNDTTRYTYDAFGNLVQVRMPRQKDGGQANGDLIEYLIDGQNRRVGKKVNGTIVKRWLYEGQLRPVDELDSDGNVTARYVYGMKVNIPEYVIKGDVTYRVIADHLGSLRLVVDQSTGSIAQRMDYDEWGNVVADSNPDFTPFGFAGGLCDRTTRLVRFGARDYDPLTARWISKDPARFEGRDDNLYRYAENNGIDFSDPEGLKLWYADAKAKRQFEESIREIMKSPKGRDLLKNLNDRREIYYINVGPDPVSKLRATGYNRNVWLDPCFHPPITTNQGMKNASTARMLAHELGHLTGVRDSGPERMDNVSTWENPIMFPLEGYIRTAYETIFMIDTVVVNPRK